ncbi:MAG: RNA-binding S4 domain-containing protein [Chitinophagales bacterium]|nr:RNA-binding S4 domain-containing protein [Chitinophagales bacterium]
MITFSIEEEYIELSKLLKATHLCSTGGEAKIVITEGMVSYNGHIDTRKRLKVRPGDEITYNGTTIKVVANPSAV